MKNLIKSRFFLLSQVVCCITILMSVVFNFIYYDFSSNNFSYFYLYLIMYLSYFLSTLIVCFFDNKFKNIFYFSVIIFPIKIFFIQKTLFLIFIFQTIHMLRYIFNLSHEWHQFWFGKFYYLMTVFDMKMVVLSFIISYVMEMILRYRDKFRDKFIDGN